MESRVAFDLKSAAKHAGVSVPTVAGWVNRPDFPAFKSGRRWVIPKASFEKWLEEQARERVQL